MSVPAPVMAARLDMALHTELSPLGFERIRARRWVAGTYPPIGEYSSFSRSRAINIRAAGDFRWISFQYLRMENSNGSARPGLQHSTYASTQSTPKVARTIGARFLVSSILLRHTTGVRFRAR